MPQLTQRAVVARALAEAVPAALELGDLAGATAAAGALQTFVDALRLAALARLAPSDLRESDVRAP